MKRRLPPLNALRAFEAAARLGRMTAAADELAVTPGAISRQVRQLEDSLGLSLFEGSKNKPELTSAARTLLPVLSAALDSIEAAVRALGDTDSGTLDVSCFSTFTVKWLIPRLFDFHSRYPDIEIRLQTAGHLGDLARERCDMTITVEASAPVQAEAGTTLPLFPERLGPVLTPALAARVGLRTPDDLAGQTLLQSQTRLNAWAMWAQAHGCAAPTPTGPVFEHYYFALQAAVAGLGICVAPWHLVADDVQAGRLLAPLGFCDSGYHYVAKRRPQRSKKLDLFGAWLQAQAAQT
ncbi:LysR substrate-binding domain-containing protein [Rhodoferax ferrireducens]|uniref:LysR substrate-binding domain-containing protein n=1 Tax=Rhodoferax ferrireducens TaxID=192843 RepID=UPI000E0D3F22|nr:LysR substrate-binding domain-containing protein [Rhodoferax ferrireducens]